MEYRDKRVDHEEHSPLMGFIAQMAMEYQEDTGIPAPFVDQFSMFILKKLYGVSTVLKTTKGLEYNVTIPDDDTYRYIKYYVADYQYPWFLDVISKLGEAGIVAVGIAACGRPIKTTLFSRDVRNALTYINNYNYPVTELETVLGK